MLFTLCCIFVLFLGVVQAAPKLESYGADPEGVSVSGISSGAAFAVQMHVAHSASILGVASFAGVPYYCAQGSIFIALYECMSGTWKIDVDNLVKDTNDYAYENKVDSTNNLKDSRVFMWHGTNDKSVELGSSEKSIEYYEHYGATIKSSLDINAGHGYPTEDYGVECSKSEYPYLNRCEYYGSFEALNHIYSGLKRPTDSYSPTGELLEFDQLEFDGSLIGGHFDSDGGYVYVPKNCTASGSKCKLHVAFHGCAMGREIMGDEFAKNAGYLEVADFNDVIVLFPQIQASIIGGNANGCWDWWGYDGMFNYATKEGSQIEAIKRMIDRVIGE